MGIAATFGIRSILIVAFDHGVCRDRNGSDIAFARVIIDHNIDFGGAIAVYDVEWNSVQGAVSVGRAIRTPVGMDRS